MAGLVQAHIQHQPSAALLHSTDFARLVRTSPAVAALPGTAGDCPHRAPWGRRNICAARAPTPPAGGDALNLAEIQLGFSLGPHGVRTHPKYFSGEYAVPLGWLSPPALPPATPVVTAGHVTRSPTGSALSVPTARPLFGRSSPFSAASPNPLACDCVRMVGHAQAAQYECRRRFADTYHRALALPGFTTQGHYDTFRRPYAVDLGSHGSLPLRIQDPSSSHIYSRTHPARHGAPRSQLNPGLDSSPG
jgi:hypothetical protein